MNRYKPHVMVLPEDDANRKLAIGFRLHNRCNGPIQILENAEGWSKVVPKFQSDHALGMYKYPNRHMVFLIDFDNDPDRLTEVKAAIPKDLAGRVYVLGVLDEPEDLTSPGQYEEFGRRMAEDCWAGTAQIWDHDLLKHNAPELQRLKEHVHPILFA